MKIKKCLAIIVSILLVLMVTFSVGANINPDDDAPLVRPGASVSEPDDDAPLVRPGSNTEDEPLVRAGDEETTTDETGSSGYLTGEDLSDTLLGYMGIINRNNLTLEQIAQLEADALEEGYIIVWEADGSATFMEEGSTLSTSSAWPNHDLAKQVPRVTSGTVIGSEVTDRSCMILMGWTLQDAMAYASQAKLSGFTLKAEEMNFMGMYVYTAQNANGLEISISFMMGAGGIEITK